MSKVLNIALASLDISAGDISANIAGLESLMKQMRNGIDVVVLPELFSTGFVSDRVTMEAWAADNGLRTIEKLHELSAMYNVAFAGSFLVQAETQLFNRAFFIEPGGDETFYDKRHLFSMSSESKILTNGDGLELPVVRFRGWNIALTVCYDLRFPVWCRNTDLMYDMLLVVANWPSSREYAWRHLLIARAIENQSYVIGVDRSGEDKFGKYDNMSMAFDFYGKPLFDPESADRLVYVSLDQDELKKWRQEFTPWKDADTFTIENH